MNYIFRITRDDGSKRRFYVSRRTRRSALREARNTFLSELKRWANERTIATPRYLHLVGAKTIWPKDKTLEITNSYCGSRYNSHNFIG